MLHSKSQPKPMLPSTHLTHDGMTAVDDASLYRSIVESLQYILITHLELSYSVNKVCQFMLSHNITRKLSRGSSNTLQELKLMAFFFESPLNSISLHLQMQTRVLILVIESLPQVILFFLEKILLLGHPTNRKQSLVAQLKLNTKVGM